MAYPYNVADWYWKVGDTNPTTHRFSSASGTYVVLADATYAAWVAAGNTATVIDTEAHLYVVINQAVLSLYMTGALFGVKETTTGVDIALSNPMTLVQFITVTSGLGVQCTLPPMNMPNSVSLGVEIVISNAPASAGDLTVNLNGGGALATIPPGGEVSLRNLANTSASGSFRPDAGASATSVGKVELATDAETITGTDTTRVITPSNLTAWASVSNTKNDTYDLTTASGTQDITGFGFNPKSVAISFSINAGSCGGVGYASSSGNQGCSVTTTDSGTTWIHQTSLAIQVSNAAATAYQLGSVSFITDGIRITWTKAGLPTGTVGMTVLGHR